MLKQRMLGISFTAITLATMLVLPYVSDLMVAEMTDSVQRTSNERGVKVTVVPKNLSNGAKAWEFEVTLETHTQSLNDDLARSAVLIAGGMQYAPLGWEGTPSGGHHRKGLLRFKTITPQPQSVELQIRLGGETAPRSFKWLMK